MQVKKQQLELDMEAGPLGTPLGLAQRKRASSPDAPAVTHHPVPDPKGAGKWPGGALVQGFFLFGTNLLFHVQF